MKQHRWKRFPDRRRCKRQILFLPENKEAQEGKTSPCAFCRGRSCREQVMRWARHRTRNRDDAEDLCQEACWGCLQGHQRLRSEAHMTAWLYKVTDNACRDSRRRGRRRPEVCQSEVNETVLWAAQEKASWEQAVRDAVQEDFKDRVHEALLALTPHQRRLLVMRYLEGRSAGAIAQELGIRKESVYTEMRRARQAFRSVYERLLKEVR